MAQKAVKTLASRNTSILLRTHIITLCLHIIFFLLRFLFSRPRLLWPYVAFAGPTLAIEFYLERLGRPRYNPADGSLRSPGVDLSAAGLTEYLWDVLYWTWGCVGAACVFGDRAWWLWIVIPLYSVWLAWTTFIGMTKGFAGLSGSAEDVAGSGVESKRQKKVDRRGGQKVQHR